MTKWNPPKWNLKYHLSDVLNVPFLYQYSIVFDDITLEPYLLVYFWYVSTILLLKSDCRKMCYDEMKSSKMKPKISPLWCTKCPISQPILYRFRWYQGEIRREGSLLLPPTVKSTVDVPATWIPFDVPSSWLFVLVLLTDSCPVKQYQFWKSALFGRDHFFIDFSIRVWSLHFSTAFYVNLVSQASFQNVWSLARINN